MQIKPKSFNPSSNGDLILAYVADLELEVDRLRKQAQAIEQEGRQAISRIHALCEGVDESKSPLPEIDATSQELLHVFDDLHAEPGYHPAHDQVIAIAVRPLVEQVFRWQQRLLGAQDAVLHVELKSEYVEWFPARFRHILDNLISNALRFRDVSKGEMRVSFVLCSYADGYELRLSDNGLGMPWNRRAEAFELLYRAGPARAAGLGVGLAVVKILVEQSGGTLNVESGNGQGTSFIVRLPRYATQDYLD